jgi:glycosyltransferase involved in cell wall biosynthesis
MDGLILLTSLACLPHRALPSWFKVAETLSAPPTDPYFGNMAEVELALDELRLRPEGARPVAGRVARRGEIRRLGDRALRRIAETVPEGIRRLGRGAIRVALAQGRFAPGLAPRPPATSDRRPGDGLPSTVTMLVPDDRIDRRVLLQGRSLARRGVEVTVVAAPYPDATDGDAAQFPELTIVRIDASRAVRRPVDVARTSLSRHAFAWREVYFYHEHFLRAALEHPAEIVVAHDLPVLPAAIAAAELGSARTFYDAHELYPEQDHFGPGRTQLLRDVEAALIGSAAAVTTINRSIAEEMARRYGIAPPSVVLNAPEADEPVPLPRTRLLRDALNLGEDRTIVLFQGSLSINRNLEPLVEAMAFVKDPSAVLVVMGPGAEKRRELEEIARARGLLGTRVLFHDAMPQSELLRFTASADIGVIPYPGIDLNTTFCTPNKLFEFMAAGLPILANDLPELRRFVADEGVGLVHAMTDAASIAAGIDRMVAADLSGFRAALRTVAPGMVWQAQEPALLDIYRDFMKGTGRTAA